MSLLRAQIQCRRLRRGRRLPRTSRTRWTLRAAVTNLLVLRSLNGPQFTFIQGAQAPSGGNGDGAIRCAYLANGASLFGFTLTNGATRTNNADVEMEQAGGGAWCDSTSAALSN